MSITIRVTMQPDGTAAIGADEASDVRAAAGASWRRSAGAVLRIPQRLLMAEADRWILWAPVAVGCGILWFFALPGPPPGMAGIVAGALALAGIVLALRRHKQAPLVALAAGAAGLVALGFAAGQLRVAATDTRLMDRAQTLRLEGRIVELAPTPKGASIEVDRIAAEGRTGLQVSARARLSLRSGAGLAVGDRIRVLARLQPPSPPLLPGGFDFARAAWFDGVGAIGFALGAVERVEAGKVGGVEAGIQRLREVITERIVGLSPDDAGHMSAALLTGEQAGIRDEVWRDMQRSGLAHLISISGLHMTMVAGILFLTLRYGLALIPAVALRLPVKKLAAVGGIIGATVYLLISGMSVPAERSWIMVVLGFTAILADRNPLSPRILAFAALAVLLWRPDSLQGPSFQLSFAAVLALIAAYEAGAGGLVPNAPWPTMARLALPLRYLLGVALTTVIASFATAPMTAWHFQSVATYGVLGNLVAVPVSSFVSMPAGMLAMGLMPFGLDAPAVLVMVASVRVVLATAHFIAGLPGAALLTPALPPAPLLLFAAGGLWLCLWRRRWRLLGLAPIAGAVALTLTALPPDILVDPTFDMAAVRGQDGVVRLLERDRDKFEAEGWRRGLGVDASEPFPASLAPPVDGLACDPAGCVFERDGRRVSLVFRVDALIEDCRDADLVIAAVGPERCAGRADLIGPRAPPFGRARAPPRPRRRHRRHRCGPPRPLALDLGRQPPAAREAERRVTGPRLTAALPAQRAPRQPREIPRSRAG